MIRGCIMNTVGDLIIGALLTGLGMILGSVIITGVILGIMEVIGVAGTIPGITVMAGEAGITLGITVTGAIPGMATGADRLMCMITEIMVTWVV